MVKAERVIRNHSSSHRAIELRDFHTTTEKAGA